MNEKLNLETSLLGVLAIGVGTTIAAGIFVLSGLAVERDRAVLISTDGTSRIK